MPRSTLAVLATLLLALLPVPPLAWSSPGSDPPALGGTITLGGTVTRGDSALAGAEVRASLFPVSAEDGFVPGSTLELLRLSPVRTRADGSFSLALPDRAELGGYLDEWGRIDLTVTISDAQVVTQFRETTPYAPDRSGRAAELTLDLSTGELTETLGDPTPQRHRLPLTSAALSAARRASAAVHPCRVTAGKMHLGRRERFMFVNNWVGAKATVRQLSGTSHTLGVGTKVSGQSWSANTSTTKTIATRNEASQTGVVDRWVRNRVNYQDFHYTGLCDYPGEHTDRVPSSVHTLISDLVRRPTLPHLTDPAGCSPRRKGYSYTKDETTNLTVTAGVDLGPVNVSAASGWTDETAWVVHVTKKSKECWSNAEGPEHSRYVQYFQFRRREPCGRHARCRPAQHRLH